MNQLKSFPSIALVFGMLWLQSCKGGYDEMTISTFLEFEEIMVVEGSNLAQATGFLGSAEEGAIFVAYRQTYSGKHFSSERVIRYDLETGTPKSHFLNREDIYTKRLHIRNNELIVIGGSFLNTYSIDLEDNLTSVIHGLSLERFGSALYNDEIYVWGGDINAQISDKVYRWNEADQRFDTVATLPGPKTSAGGEIIDGRLYIFGGREDYESNHIQDDIYIVDLATGSTATQRLPGPVHQTFTVNNEGVIYVSGQSIDSYTYSKGINIFFGVYNPNLQVFKEFKTNLNDDGIHSVNAMTRIGNKIYILYGNAQDENASMSIMEAEIP